MYPNHELLYIVAMFLSSGLTRLARDEVGIYEESVDVSHLQSKQFYRGRRLESRREYRAEKQQQECKDSASPTLEQTDNIDNQEPQMQWHNSEVDDLCWNIDALDLHGEIKAAPSVDASVGNSRGKEQQTGP